MKGKFFYLGVFFSWLQLFSQHVVEGKVLDAETQSPLAGAQIVVQGTFIGTYSMHDGKFVLKVRKEPPYTLMVSYLGYTTDTIHIEKIPSQPVVIALKPKSYLTQEVVIQGIRLTGHEIPTFTKLEKHEIEQKNVGTDVPTVLNLLPSVTVNTDAGTGIGYTSLWIRGTDISRINVTLNGVPYNDPESHGVWWVDIPDIISSANDVQVQRGVGTSTNGAPSFGASININTFEFNSEPYAQLSLKGGYYNTRGSTLRFGTGLLNNHWTIDGRGSYLYSDGYIDRAFAQLQSFQLNTGWYGSRDIFRFMIMRGQEKTYQAWYGVPKDSLEKNRTFNPYTYKNEIDFYQQGHYHLLYSHKFNEFWTSSATFFLTTGYGYYEQFKKQSKLSNYGLNPLIIGNDTILKSDVIRRKFLDNDFYGLVFSADYNSHRKWMLNLGGNISQYYGRHFGRLIWMQYADSIPFDYEYYRAWGLKNDGSMFAKLTFTPMDRLKLFLDLQGRVINYGIWGLDDEAGNVNLERSYLFWNPKFGLSYDVNDWKFFGYAGIAHREPTRYMFVEADSGKIPVPERLYDYEFAVQKKGPSYIIQLNPYYMIYKDQFVQTGEINSVGAPIFVNVPNSYRAGVEAIFQWQINQNVKWDFNATYSSNIIKDITLYVDNWDTGLQDSYYFKKTNISFSPNVILNSQLRYDFLRKFYTILETKYVSRQYIDLSSNKERSLDPYEVFNFNVGMTFNTKLIRSVDMMISMRNIFSEKYETNAWVYRYKEGGVEKEENGYFPQAPFHVFGVLNLKF